MKNQLENASKRLQMELDTIGLFHSLRTKEEFSRLAVLWKKFANLSFAFHTMSGPGIRLIPADEEDRTRYLAKHRENFEAALKEAQQFFYEEMVFIPEPIAKAAQETVKDVLQEPYAYRALCAIGGSEATQRYNDFVRNALERFDSGSASLERLIREHIRGESPSKTEMGVRSDPKSGLDE
jgi:hypothetical protein